MKYSYGTPQYIYYLLAEERVYFGKYIGNANTSLMSGGTAVGQDRVGSVGKYFPYGEERNNPQLPNDTVKFATYTRDSATGLDYADQRYYTSGIGRFTSVDPYPPKGGKQSPAAWNRYSYTGGDPINGYDPNGLLTLVINGAFGDSPSWLDANSPEGAAFLGAIQATFGESPQPWRWPGLGVSAFAFYAGVYAAGADLADFINRWQFQPGDKLNIIAFSEGGNVVKVAACVSSPEICHRYDNLGLNHAIDNLVTLGTPQSIDLPLFGIDAPVPKDYCNVYSLADPIQVAGSSFFQLYEIGISLRDSAEAQFLAWEAFLSGNFDDFIYYEELSVVYADFAYFWWLTTKIDFAATNVELISDSHFDLHTAGVWNKAVDACGLHK